MDESRKVATMSPAAFRKERHAFPWYFLWGPGKCTFQPIVSLSALYREGVERGPSLTGVLSIIKPLNRLNMKKHLCSGCWACPCSTGSAKWAY